ncbi:MAG: acetylglutamate kinase [Balneolaceae bacterium]
MSTLHRDSDPSESLLSSLAGRTMVVKVGGNALQNRPVLDEIVRQIARLHKTGASVVVVHGGGIEIAALLETAGIESHFVGGHRVTGAESIRYVEMALSGNVNKQLVSRLLHAGVEAVGISGKDGRTVTAKKRIHRSDEEGTEHDLGFVGDASDVNPGLIRMLLTNGYCPVLSPISVGEDGEDYNINADMFAGAVAGALAADTLVAMTNITGLLRDINDPESRLEQLTADEARALFGSVIQGGMIPKVEACLYALESGVRSVSIIDGTEKGNLLRILAEPGSIGTTFSGEKQPSRTP